MPTPDEPIASPADYRGEGGERLLIHEVKSLGAEVARFRGDTKHLNDIVIPKEEHARRRRVYGRLAALSLAAVVLTLALFGYLLYKVSQQGDETRKTAYEVCQARNAQTQQSAKAVVQINMLLGTLRDTEAVLRDESSGSHAAAVARQKRIDAYDRYLAFVAEISPASPVTSKPPSCDQFKK